MKGIALSPDDCPDSSFHELTPCLMEAHKGKREEIGAVLYEIESTWASQEEINEVLSIQSLWEQYVEAECRSQVIYRNVAGGAQYQECMYKHAEARLAELKKRNCTENGCPFRKEESSP